MSRAAASARLPELLGLAEARVCERGGGRPEPQPDPGLRPDEHGASMQQRLGVQGERTNLLTQAQGANPYLAPYSSLLGIGMSEQPVPVGAGLLDRLGPLLGGLAAASCRADGTRWERSAPEGSRRRARLRAPGRRVAPGPAAARTERPGSTLGTVEVDDAAIS